MKKALWMEMERLMASRGIEGEDVGAYTHEHNTQTHTYARRDSKKYIPLECESFPPFS